MRKGLYMNYKLKPCPFCGKEAQYEEYMKEGVVAKYRIRHYCNQFHTLITTFWHKDKEKLANRWNERV